MLTADELGQITTTLKAIALAANSLQTAIDLLSLNQGKATALEVGTSLAALLGELTEFTLGERLAGNYTFDVTLKLTDAGNALAAKHSALLTIARRVK